MSRIVHLSGNEPFHYSSVPAELQPVVQLMKQVFDPEVPVLNIIDLGVLRGIEKDGETIRIRITPTYSGCPAMKAIEDDITSAMRMAGYQQFSVETNLSPAWTTDWLTEEACEKLRAYGIAPPEKTTADKNILFGKAKLVKCPRCKSENTTMISQFGSTSCKALWKCDDCKEPFDYFKCI